MLESNPCHPALQLHKLKGNLQEYYSVSINVQYRIMIDFIIRDDQVILIDIADYINTPLTDSMLGGKSVSPNISRRSISITRQSESIGISFAMP